jgi:hypothetical protein
MFFLGQNTQAAGTYWNMRNGERIDMELGGQLSGNRNMIYVKAPRAVMLAAGPVLGLNFAVFLPFIWIAMAVSSAWPERRSSKVVRARLQAACPSAGGPSRPTWRAENGRMMPGKRRKIQDRHSSRRRHEKGRRDGTLSRLFLCRGPAARHWTTFTLTKSCRSPSQRYPLISEIVRSFTATTTWAAPGNSGSPKTVRTSLSI